MKLLIDCRDSKHNFKHMVGCNLHFLEKTSNFLQYSDASILKYNLYLVCQCKFCRTLCGICLFLCSHCVPSMHSYSHTHILVIRYFYTIWLHECICKCTKSQSSTFFAYSLIYEIMPLHCQIHPTFVYVFYAYVSFHIILNRCLKDLAFFYPE